jgi:hypothetical protein
MDKTALVWDRNSNWRAGDLSTTAVNPRVSSFAVMDEILAPFADRARYPNVARIVVAGHSAGRQFAQRYALARRDVPGMPPVSYLVANPSSVVYLDARRPIAGDAPRFAATDFAVPAPTGCKTNHYQYGLEKPNAYVKRDPALAAGCFAGRTEICACEPPGPEMLVCRSLGFREDGTEISLDFTLRPSDQMLKITGRQFNARSGTLIETSGQLACMLLPTATVP